MKILSTTLEGKATVSIYQILIPFVNVCGWACKTKSFLQNYSLAICIERTPFVF